MDPAGQTAVEPIKPPASSPTLCRLENRADRAAARALHGILVDQFIAACRTPPTELSLAFDGTEDRAPGRPEGAHLHGCDGDCGFLPPCGVCGEQRRVACLRPGSRGAARHARAILKLRVQRLRQAWPQVKIIFRGDAGFCRWRLPRWCENHGVQHLVGLAQNPRLLAAAQPLMRAAEHAFQTSQARPRHFGEVQQAAAAWDKERRVIVKAGHTAEGSRPRGLVTNRTGAAQAFALKLMVRGGEMENRIREQQPGLFADRTSCHDGRAGRFRRWLAGFACVLLERLRPLGLAGTERARAQAGTIRLKRLKIGAVGLRRTRRSQRLVSRSHPCQRLFGQVAQTLGSG